MLDEPSMYLPRMQQHRELFPENRKTNVTIIKWYNSKQDNRFLLQAIHFLRRHATLPKWHLPGATASPKRYIFSLQFNYMMNWPLLNNITFLKTHFCGPYVVFSPDRLHCYHFLLSFSQYKTKSIQFISWHSLW